MLFTKKRADANAESKETLPAFQHNDNPYSYTAESFVRHILYSAHPGGNLRVRFSPSNIRRKIEWQICRLPCLLRLGRTYRWVVVDRSSICPIQPKVENNKFGFICTLVILFFVEFLVTLFIVSILSLFENFHLDCRDGIKNRLIRCLQNVYIQYGQRLHFSRTWKYRNTLTHRRGLYNGLIING